MLRYFLFHSFDFFFHPKISFPSLVFCFLNLLSFSYHRSNACFSVCISLISFRTTFPVSFNSGFSFSSSCMQNDFPSFLRFVSLPSAISLYCYFSIVSGYHCWCECDFPLFKCSGYCFWSLCSFLLQPPTLSGLFILRWTGTFADFPYNYSKNLLFFIFFQIIWSAIGLLQLFPLVNILLLPIFWIAFLSIFLLPPRFLLWILSVRRRIPGFQFSSMLRFFCFFP